MEKCGCKVILATSLASCVFDMGSGYVYCSLLYWLYNHVVICWQPVYKGYSNQSAFTVMYIVSIFLFWLWGLCTRSVALGRSNCEGLLHSVKTSSPPFPPLNLYWGISLPQCNESRGSMDGIQDLLTLPAFLTRVRTHLGQVTFPGLVCSCPALCSPSKILIGSPKQPQGCLWISLKLLHSVGLHGVCIRGAPLNQAVV